MASKKIIICKIVPNDASVREKKEKSDRLDRDLRKLLKGLKFEEMGEDALTEKEVQELIDIIKTPFAEEEVEVTVEDDDESFFKLVKAIIKKN